MKWGFALLVLLLGATTALVARADAPLPAWNDNAAQAWWAQKPTPDKWVQAADQLQARLEADYKSNGASVFSDSDFQGWLEHLEWVRLGLECPDVLADPGKLKTFVTLGNDTAVSHLFIEKLDPLDVRDQALLNLLKLAQANLDDLNDYAALGVAFCLVFDQPFPDHWPHSQVDPQAVPIGDLDVVTRFNFYVQADRDKKTELDLTQQTFENLKYLVDSEVKLSELAYAQSNPKRIPYSQFEQAFFSIKYDDSRNKPSGFVYQWPFPTYQLADIETNGGICVDQAYYATILGKGLGIPTLYFTGEGTSGGHAWFGYLTRSGRWELDCGRYAEQNYPRGYARDPQTWQRIDDTVLTNLFKNGSNNPNYQPAMTALAWARMHAASPGYRQILDDARGIMPEWAATWRLEGGWMERNVTDVDQKKAFYQQWITQFQSFAVMKVLGQRHLLALLKQTNDPDAAGLEQDIVLQNRSEDFDLGITGSAGVLSDKIAVQDWDGAKLEFEQAIRDFADQGGGSLYKAIISYYVKSCLKAGRTAQAGDGIRFVEERVTMDPKSQVGQAFADLKASVAEAEKEGAAPAP
jgi:hypothetical protein